MKNISRLIKNAESIGFSFKNRMGSYKCIYKPNRKRITKINSFGSKYYFKTNLADSYTKKIAGLQSINNLEENECMLFEYKRAQNLSFHMGSVKYPIDIIFLKDNKIKKISHNVPPGDCGIYACVDSDSVIEVNGGLCKKLSIKEGGSVSYFDSVNKEDSSSYIFKLSDFVNLQKSNISFLKMLITINII